MRALLFLLMPLLASAAFAAEPATLPKPPYLMEQVKARALLADPACVAKQGEAPGCYCALEIVYPRFITASPAKPATATSNAVPAEPPNPNALPKAEELNAALRAFVDGQVEEGACPSNYSQKRPGNPQDFMANAVLASRFGAVVTFQKGDYLGLTYRYYDREGDEPALLYHRGLLLNVATGEATDLPDLLGGKQDAVLNREMLRQQRAQARGLDGKGFEKPFDQGRCESCMGYYYTPDGLTIELLGMGKDEEPVVVEAKLPVKFITDPKLRALFAPGQGTPATPQATPVSKAK